MHDGKKAVLPQGNRAMPQVFFWLKFANNIHYKYKISQASKATLQSSKHAGTKHNLTQNQDSKSIKVTCLEKQWGNK